MSDETLHPISATKIVMWIGRILKEIDEAEVALGRCRQDLRTLQTQVEKLRHTDAS